MNGFNPLSTEQTQRRTARLILGVMLMVAVAGAMWISWNMKPMKPAPNAKTYISSGMWRADARTLVAAFNYLLEPERPGTNQAAVHA